MDTIFDDIKSRIDIVQLVSEYVQLKKAGRNFKGLCPFHNEKTPSFMVSPEKQIAYCFGCHNGGDIFKFVQEVESFDTHEAIEYLADKVGLDLSKYKKKQFSSEERKIKKEKNTILKDLCNESAVFYEKQLWKTDSGVKVLSYLKNRGLNEDTIHAFRLGLSPDSYNETYNYLISKKYTKDDMVLAGQVSVKSTDSSKVFDRFRLRLMFPIADIHGKIVGFGGRVLKKDDNPKYLNSPDSPIYDKSRILYGFDKAKDSIRKLDNILFVEGYFDVISVWQSGVKNVVATSGTAITDQQLKKVKRFTKNVILNFDSDLAGQKATLRAVELSIANELNVNIVDLGDYKDPDDACKAGVYNDCLKKSKYYLDYYFDKLITDIDVNSALSKLQICEHFFDILKFSSEKIEIQHYLEKLSYKLHIELENLIDKFKKHKKQDEKHMHNMKNSDTEEVKLTKQFSPQEYFFGFLLAFPVVIESLKGEITENDFDSHGKDVYKYILDHYNSSASLSGKIVKDLHIVSLFIETQYGERFNKEDLCDEALNILARVKALKDIKRKKELKFQMQEARSKGDSKEEEQFFKKYSELIHRKKINGKKT